MIGAREYAELFKTGQYDRLYIVSGSHARGKTFRIQVLPKDETAIPNGDGNLCLNKDAVTVYDIISGQPGWAEIYGWLHEGKWQADFFDLVEKQMELLENERKQTEVLSNKYKQTLFEREKLLLSQY